MSEKINCMGTDEVTCPYCGVAWENSEPGGQDDDTEENCEECGKTYYFSADYSITYFSKKVPCMNGAPHEWKDYVYYGVIVGGVYDSEKPYKRCKHCRIEDFIEEQS